MNVDEKTGIKFNLGGKDYYFCSNHCLEKFKKQNKIEASGLGEICNHCVPQTGQPLWKNKVLIMFTVYTLSFVLGYFLKFFAPLSMALWMYIQKITIPVLFGLFLGGVIDWVVPSEYISLILAQKRKRTIIYSVVTGFLMSACSHGILAIAIQLYKKGASPPAVVAFLLASPWANLPLTILMFGFFGFKAFVIVFSAVVIALISGYVFLLLESKGLIERNPNTAAVPENFSVIADAGKRIRESEFNLFAAIKGIWNGSLSLANMVLWWIMLGMFLSSLVAAYLPAGFMSEYMGPTILGLLATLALATVMEICSEGTAPLAFEIFRQTGALGNSFVFLMAGVVTDYTEIGLLWTNVGPRTAVWLPVIAVPQVVLLGWIFNLIF
ncbi:hypothetical protein A2232_02265 [candidate division WOR-1 bacterium RIFOXYA2_FULL_46_56]|uniref:TRASH domain-containing protein n=1 Tax=candidate division WOR-1 bacterium RIFOXYC2_FULL_46_14 TaxID=1802587 RepID=A0A1F4U6Q1_UNCSA|nr:MAG: hypothetical protein A2292_02265 [candidate division WOR-1 bacterium RIFOXYB2_FULL_46_45]OGC30481.1 MAG: hypothetical protein A2232_02265 [candidate division WOR-1 bacterium RIFOXYA2_FULL_46_56]OGC40549.1 MAG: hypothetical protein A2438_05980 [candidate division WOR-1 bacterium RIFOXYC2_FULL_46_14]